MTRPELCYCIVCGGAILPVDSARYDDVGDSWTCAICDDPGQLRLLDEEMDLGVYSRGEEGHENQ